MRDLIDCVVVAAEKKVLDIVAGISARILFHNQKCIKEISVVLGMVDRFEVGGLIAATQSRKSVDVVRVPIAEMLNVGMFCFQHPKHSLLMLAILEETCWRSIGIRARSQHARDLNVEVGAFFLVSANDS